MTPASDIAARLLRRGAALRRDASGVSAVEFAIILPLLILLYVGAADLADSLTAKRRTTQATTAAVDLVARREQVTAADLDNVYAAATGVMAPYPADRLRLTLTSISIDAQGAATVVWSQAYGGASARTAGSSVSLPASIADVRSSGLIMGETAYLHPSITGMVVETPVEFRETYYQRPRVRTVVAMAP